MPSFKVNSYSANTHKRTYKQCSTKGPLASWITTLYDYLITELRLFNLNVLSEMYAYAGLG